MYPVRVIGYLFGLRSVSRRRNKYGNVLHLDHFTSWQPTRSNLRGTKFQISAEFDKVTFNSNVLFYIVTT